MFKRKLLLLVVGSLCFLKISSADPLLNQSPSLFGSDMDQHGAFVANDLLTSPLLRSMFNLSANDVPPDSVRICLNQQAKCRVVRRDSKVYVVSINGKSHFDDTINSSN
jgi:ribosomal protein L36